MAQEIIEVGAAANDGNGDPLRDAMIKSNNNFTELYIGLLNTPSLVNEISSNYTLLDTDTVVNCIANSFIITLPSVASFSENKLYNVKNSGTGTITLQGPETIDDNANQLLTQYDSITILSTGSKWIII